MNTEFVNITAENLFNEHLCCIIRSRKPHQGVDAKRQWLSERLQEGHVFRKLNDKAAVFIEYAPLETAWVPIVGENFYYIYCLWVNGASNKGKGYGKALMEYCLADAKEKGNPAYVCWERRSKSRGFPTSRLRKSLDFQLLTRPKTDMNCLRFLLTEQHQSLHKM